MSRPKDNPQLKVLHGNFRRDRDSHGPIVAIALPDCPTWLPKEAKKYWKQIGPELVNAGLIAAVDGAAFAAHCDTVGKFEQVTKKLKTVDNMTDTTPSDYVVQSALLTIRNKLWDQLMKSSREFGLTPTGRSQLKTTGQQQLPLGGFEDL